MSGRERTSAPDLEELTRWASKTRDERISLELIAAVDTRLAPPVVETNRFRNVRWPFVAGLLALGIVFGGTGTTAVQHALAGDAKPEPLLIVHRKSASDLREEPPELSVEPVEPTSTGGLPDAEATESPEIATAAEPEAVRPRRQTPRRPSATAAPSPEPTAEPRPEPTPVVAPAPLSPRPGRAAVRAAFSRIHDGVQACGDVEQIGTTMVARVVFDGDTGRVRSAEVVDSDAPPAVRSCVARVARTAHLAPFGNDELSVRYPFRL